MLDPWDVCGTESVTHPWPTGWIAGSRRMRLVESVPTSKGVIIATYEPA